MNGKKKKILMVKNMLVFFKQNTIDCFFSLDFEVNGTWTWFWGIHSSGSYTVQEKQCSATSVCSAHLYCSTLSLPACPQLAPFLPRYLTGPLSLSTFSLSSVNLFLYFSRTEQGPVIREPEILSVLLTFSLLKSTRNAQAPIDI